jgi:Putative DNA-binding domain
MDLVQALDADEGQTIEFKKSLREFEGGVHTLVGFANAQGGDLFFGVTPDRRPIGVDLGAQSIEKLTNEIRAHIYPDLPLVIDPLPGDEQRPVLRISAPRDVPPVVGAYLCSSSPLELRSRVNAAELVAYRRVGKVTQHVDFMWLRPQLQSDPRLLLDKGGSTRGQLFPTKMSGTAWLDSGSGSAHGLSFRLDPELAPVLKSVRDLPRSDGARSVSWSFDLGQPAQLPESVLVIATYRDDWGCTWESGRRLILVRQGELCDLDPTSDFYRRIVEFPPKVAPSL